MAGAWSPRKFSRAEIDGMRDTEVFGHADSLIMCLEDWDVQVASDPPTWALLPCGHKIFCGTCIKLYMHETNSKSRFEDKKCPKCRQPIATTQRIYD